MRACRRLMGIINGRGAKPRPVGLPRVLYDTSVVTVYFSIAPPPMHGEKERVEQISSPFMLSLLGLDVPHGKAEGERKAFLYSLQFRKSILLSVYRV